MYYENVNNESLKKNGVELIYKFDIDKISRIINLNMIFIIICWFISIILLQINHLTVKFILCNIYIKYIKN